MLNKNFKNNHLLRSAFGWNYKSWSHPLKFSNYKFPSKFSSILELGASKQSIVSLIFDGLAEEIVISYYDEKQRKEIQEYFLFIEKKRRLKSKYKLKKIDAFEIKGEFDLVLMKSVLGGLFREYSSSKKAANNFINDLIRRTVIPGGHLLLIDNGKSFFENLISKFGARKNNWRFFRKADFKNPNTQLSFGFLSSFSLETRLGKFGFFIDNYIFYYLDRMIYKFWNHNPTVIVSIYKNDETTKLHKSDSN